MTLEEVIADCEEEISDCQIDLDGISELLEEYPERKEAFGHEIDDYKKRMDYNRQLAEWLRELAERRKQPEIVSAKTVRIGTQHGNTILRQIITIVPMIDGIYGGDFYCAKAERRTYGSD